MITLKHLTKKYDEQIIFDDVSFKFPNQGLCFVLGPSGSGKSTLFNLLAGFDTEYQGEIEVSNLNLSKLNKEALCQYRKDHVGFIFQAYHLLQGYTAFENVMLASDIKNGSEKEALNLLEKLGILDKAHQKIENLSGGQKQRVAIARALIQEPSVIFADEPTGALDSKNAKEIMKILKEIAKNQLVIVITHDKKLIAEEDFVIEIKNHQLVSNQEVKQDEEKQKLSITSAPKLSLFKRAFQNFKVHLKNELLIALAISIGCVCMSLSLSSKDMMKTAILDFEKKNTAYHQGFIQIENNEQQLLDLLNQETRIENVYLQYVLNDIEISVGNQSVHLDTKYPISKATQQMSYGTMPQNSQKEIALNPSLASQLDKNIQNLIGKEAKITYQDQKYQVTVSGVFNGIYDDFVVSSDIEKQMYQNQETKAYSMSYEITNFEDIVKVNEQLKKQNIQTQNASKEVANFLDMFSQIKQLFTMVSIIIFAVGVLVSMVLMNKQQKTRYHEVGLLSCLGYNHRQIKKILVDESILLFIITVLLSDLLLILIPLFTTTWIKLLLTNSFVLLIVLFITLQTTKKLIKIDPAKALRQ